MTLTQEEIKKILVSQNYVSKEDIEKAQAYEKEKGVSYIDFLFEKEILNRNILGQAIAEYYRIQYSNLAIRKPIQEIVLKIPEEIARKYSIVLFEESEKFVLIATSNPENSSEIARSLATYFPRKIIKVGFAFVEDIESSFSFYKRSLKSRFADIIEKKGKVAPEIFNEILEDAIIFKASDIHFEPQEKEVIIRFRVDGILQEAGVIAKELFENIINRIKVQSHMRIDEHYTAQDGAIRFTTLDKTIVDLRVSIVPTMDGEKVVIRILSQYLKQFTLNDVGLSEEDENMVIYASKKPFGMILTTGPTGSGKTTTLYTILKMLNSNTINITTIEDPVEYRIPGINQIQVNQQTNLTFAKGLRSIVRQDPNVILVGEIRDGETAEIAVNAALTGHLLLSTFHANDAATAIPRLFDMGIEPFLLASTLNLVMSQRLVRTICSNCRHSVVYTQKDLKKYLVNPKKFFPTTEVTLYEGKGCSACNNTGFKDRIAIFEIIYITHDMQELILTKPAMSQISDLAKKEGFKTFFEDGIEKVKSGITTLEELVRVAPPPFDINKDYNAS
ncbi:MAG: GspE/PulE family protein [bacterium]